jgi:hypothetical protein
LLLLLLVPRVVEGMGGSVMVVVVVVSVVCLFVGLVGVGVIRLGEGSLVVVVVCCVLRVVVGVGFVSSVALWVVVLRRGMVVR